MSAKGLVRATPNTEELTPWASWLREDAPRTGSVRFSVIKPIPGNRLYETAEGRVEIAVKPYYEALGTLFRPLVRSAKRMAASLSGKVAQIIPSFSPARAWLDCTHSVIVNRAVREPIRDMIDALCDPTDETVAVEGADLNEAEVDAVAATLQRLRDTAPFRSLVVAKVGLRSLGHSPARPLSVDVSCLNDVTAGRVLSEAVQDLVQNLCDPAVTAVALRSTSLNEAEIGAIGQALQRTAANSLWMRDVYTDTAALASAIVAAWQVNPNLRDFYLWFFENQPQAFMTPKAFRTLIQGLPCSNVTSFESGSTDITSLAAETFATTFQQNPFSAPNTIRVTWYAGLSDEATIFPVLLRGLAASPCIRDFGHGRYSAISKDSMLQQVQVMGANQTISNIYTWCQGPYSYNATEKQIVRDAVTNNMCFLSFTNTLASCFSPDLDAYIRNITLGRTPCARDARCAPKDCSTPSPSAAPTVVPSSAPSAAPSTAPSPRPTAPPSSAPSPAPTPDSTAAAAAVAAGQQTNTVAIVLGGAAGGAMVLAVALVVKARAKQSREAAALRAQNAETVGLEEPEGGGQLAALRRQKSGGASSSQLSPVRLQRVKSRGVQAAAAGAEMAAVGVGSGRPAARPEDVSVAVADESDADARTRTPSLHPVAAQPEDVNDTYVFPRTPSHAQPGEEDDQRETV